MNNTLEPGSQGRGIRMDEIRARLISSLPVEDRRLSLAGIPTALLEGGAGSPVVLLHGQGEFAATWLRVIPHLVKHHRVIAVDLPGHGASGVGENTLDDAQMNAWLRSLIQQTCSVPPILSGHLLGGAIALRFAVAHANRLERLVLVDTLGLGPYRPSLRFALPMVAFIAAPSEGTRDRLFSRCMADLDDVRTQLGDRWDDLAAYALECARTPGLKKALRNLMPGIGMPAIPTEALTQIDIPVGMIWGRHDLQVRLSTAQEAHERYDWPLHVIDNAADDPAIEQPHAFLQAWTALVGRTQPEKYGNSPGPPRTPMPA